MAQNGESIPSTELDDESKNLTSAKKTLPKRTSREDGTKGDASSGDESTGSHTHAEKRRRTSTGATPAKASSKGAGKRGPAPNSFVWTYIKRLDEDDKMWKHYISVKKMEKPSRCEICGHVLETISGTSNLIRHLSSRHGITPDNSSKRFLGVGAPGKFGVGGKIDLADQMAYVGQLSKRSLDEQYVNFIASELISPESTESDSFRDWLRTFNPRWQQPAEPALRDLMAEAADTCRAQIREEIQSIDNIHISIEAWTSITSQIYVTVTAHWLSSTFIPHSVVLATRTLTDSESSEEVQEVAQAICKELDIEAKVVYTVSDQEIDSTSHKKNVFRCGAGAIDQAVRAGLQNNAIDKVVHKVRRLTSIFFTNATASKALVEAQQALGSDSVIHPARDVPALWCTTVEMLARLDKLKNVLPDVQHRLVAEAQKSDNTGMLRKVCDIFADSYPAEDEWQLINELVLLLQPFQKAIDILVHGSTYATLSVMVPVIVRLKSNLESKRNQKKSEIIKATSQIIERHLSTWVHPVAGGLKAAFFDPRFKTLSFFASNKEKEEAIASLTEELDAVAAAHSISGGAGVFGSRSSGKSKSDNTVGDGFFFFPSRNNEQGENETGSEFENYKQFPAVPNTDTFDAFNWWQRQRPDFPALAKLAQKYLAVPATCVPIKQLFTEDGQRALFLRAQFDDNDLVDNILVVRSWEEYRRAAGPSEVLRV